MNDSMNSIPSRRHDLDALRGIAMLLGIFLHAAIAYSPDAGRGWPIQDSQSSQITSLFIAMVHGFRMPLFFLLSGFFTMMLYRRRGMSKLIEHRILRIAIPFVIGMSTIIPSIWIVAGHIQANPSANVTVFDETDLLIPGVQDDLAAVEKALAAGADVNQRSEQGDSPFLVAAFLGRDDIAEVLLDHDADPELGNHKGERPIDVMRAPWGTTEFVAGLLQIEVDREDVESGREKIAAMMGETLSGPSSGMATDGGANAVDWKGLMFLLFEFPATGHLWFLWFLCFLVTGFVLVMTLTPRGWRSRLNLATVVRSPHCLLWLIPLTMLPHWFMRHEGFGPATSVGLLPMPSVLAYYALFFGFGAIYFDADDHDGNLSRGWKISLPLSLTVLFGIGWALRGQTDGGGLVASVLIQSAYAWCVSFGMMGLFRTLFAHPSRSLRYLSDSSYWLYLAHLPLVMYLQFWVRDWEVPLLVKFTVVSVISSVVLLISYQVFVRYTPIGWLLNGKRKPAAPNVNEPSANDAPGSEVVAAQLVR
ncbi:similar to glucans biosynthesis protein mdoC-putative transmembrane protein [Rhodopirellula baltica SH 1]|uniref:Similar to glucans biosynthesis protein mdoC-putative transmembrane protein n=2 Tax=Rhodopirellula baltica TaxID=265606 RepID=Q7UES3_RHOBA|nr:similar to glucans biosynthesis protein mdoC-putative transmembrane protein [Rhodopirellula baltica SH 1]